MDSMGAQKEELDMARQRIAQLEETVSTLTRRDAEQQQREENWQHCFQEFKDLANGKERKYEQIHAVVLKDKIAQLEAEVARLTADEQRWSETRRWPRHDGRSG